MADALVSAVVKAIIGNLNSAVLKESGLLWGLKEELNKLESIFETIQLVLHDAELKQRQSEAIQNWLRKLKHAAYDAENILDLIATDGLRRRANSERGMQYRLQYFLSSRNPLLFRVKMAREVRNITKKLNDIAEERTKFHLGEGLMENRYGVTLESRHTSSLVNELEIYGRDEEKDLIVKALIGGACDQNSLSVYAIRGMGGLGKTALAQMVYNSEEIKEHFGLRIWVCVSDDFRIQAVVEAILEYIEGRRCDVSTMEALMHRLQERLRGRRFLLVLDDIWNENQRLSDELKEILSCGSKGSVLIITTRSEKVASLMAPIAIHHINQLSEDDSWSLFRKRAFANGEGEESFIAMGKAIVKKCGGVPLAIKAIGSLMRFKSDEREWLAVKDSEMLHLLDDENPILPVLRLSYDNLLPQMRQCFAYCCTFPKDYRMNEKKLIQLWMANGYISLGNQTDMHLMGRLIFKELVCRSFLQDVERDYVGNMTCKMHDLMHELACSVMEHESCLLDNYKVAKVPKTLHHLSFASWRGLNNKSALKLPMVYSLRSVIVQIGYIHPSGWKGLASLVSKQQYLRTLDLYYNTMNKKLLDRVYRLEHLRYLVIECLNIKRLPESLINLLNLQTLKLKNSRCLLELPKDLRVMKNLWFVEMEFFDSLISTPPGLGDLTYLRGLSVFIVGQDASHQIHQLKKLDLGGELSIKGLDNVRSYEDAKSANLLAKTSLTRLSLYWERGTKEKSAEHFEAVLEGLQPHQNLENISIESYYGSRFPNWMQTPAFGKLKNITLRNCPRCEHLPPFGKLPFLEHLSLFGMDSLKHLDSECYGDGEISFPSLTNLTVCEMFNFKEWTVVDTVECFPCLKELTVQSCSKLTRLPKLPNIRTLDLSDSSEELLRSITSLSSLTSLKLSNFKELDVFPSGLLQNHVVLERFEIKSLRIESDVLDNLSALKNLILQDCLNLEFIPEGLKYLGSLEILEISGCHDLRSFPANLLEGLSSLRELIFQNCKKLKPLSGPLKQAPAINNLLLHWLPELEYLPESVQQLRDVELLSIADCNALSSLPNWIGSLESLSRIKIWYCEMLTSLPDGFKALKSLRHLDIWGCPELEKRCKKPKGEDWLKISHIPKIRINDKEVQYLDE